MDDHNGGSDSHSDKPKTRRKGPGAGRKIKRAAAENEPAAPEGGTVVQTLDQQQHVADQSFKPRIRLSGKAPSLPAHYEIVEELGRGGMGVVYRAVDTNYGRDVAIKVLPSTASEESILKRFRREASDLASVFHPNVVSFYEVGEHEGEEYIVMEYVDGGNLAEYLSRTDSLKDILSAFVSVCNGLAHIHNRGIVHRDLKPENVLINRQGIPKIMDFGLARRLETRTHLTDAGTILGTYSYLAPEQILSSQVGPAADLYALGICLFQAVTRSMPFKADTDYGLLQCHLEKKPPRLCDVRPGLPKKLDVLVAQLLEKKSEDRPRSAEAVRGALQSCLDELSLGPEQGTLLGRSEDLHRVSAIAEGCCRGEGVACLLAAPGGVGRSRFLQELAVRLKSRDIHVLFLAPSLDLLPALESVFAALGAPVGECARLREAGGASALAGSLRRRLSQRSEPTLLLADDVERLDSLTQETLESLSRLTPPGNAGWILSLTRARASTFPQSSRAVRVDLEPLADAEIVTLAARAIGGEPGDRLKDWLVPRAAGSPRDVLLLLTALRGTGGISEEGGVWKYPETLPFPSGVTEAVLETLEEIDEGSRGVLRTAALLKQPFSFDLLHLGSGLSEVEADDAVERLVGMGILEETGSHLKGEQFCFTSRQIRQKIASSLSTRLNRRLHARIAAALKEVGGSRAELGRHLALAHQCEEALGLLARAARQTHAQGLYEEANELWGLATGCLETQDSPAAQPVLLGAAETLAALGRTQEALTSLERLSRRKGSDLSQRLYTLRLLAQLRRQTGASEQAQSLCLQAVQEAGDPSGDPGPDVPRELRLIYELLCSLQEEQGHRPAALEALRNALRLARDGSAPEQVARLLQREGQLLLDLGQAATAEASFRKGLDVARSLGQNEEILACLEKLADTYRALQQPEKAMESYASALETARAMDRPDRQARLYSKMGKLHETQGDLPSAIAAHQKAVEVLRPSGENPELAAFLETLGHLQQAQGATAEAEQILQESLNVSQISSGEAPSRVRQNLGLIMLQDGRFEEALECLRGAVNCADGDGDARVLAEALANLSTAYRKAGQAEDSVQAAERSVTKARESGVEQVLAQALLVLGEACVEKHHWRTAVESLDEARPLISAEMHPELYLRFLQASERLHSRGADQGFPGLSKAEAQQLRERAEALKTRLQEAPSPTGAETPPRDELAQADPTRALPAGKETRRMPREALARPREQGSVAAPALRPDGRRPGLIPWLLGAVVLAALVFLGLKTWGSGAGTVVVATLPDGAEVLIDGIQRGTTPDAIQDLPPGSYSITLVKSGYAREVVEVKVQPGSSTKLNVALKREVAVDLNPPGATLLIAGQPMDPAKALTLAPGEFEVEVQLEGYEPHKSTFTVPPEGDVAALKVALQPLKGSLKVTSEPGGATVMVDREPRGVTPLELQLSPGEHQVNLSLKDYKPSERAVVVKSRETAALTFTLEGEYGELKLTSDPSGAKLLLNGVNRGKTPLSLKDLSPGEYKLQVSKDGYEAHRGTAKITAGQTRNLHVALPELPARPAYVPPAAPAYYPPSRRWYPPPRPSSDPIFLKD